MKNIDFRKVDYFSYGVDCDETDKYYWYLQTCSDGYEDTEIISSKYKFVPLVIGKILSTIKHKKLVKW